MTKSNPGIHTHTAKIDTGSDQDTGSELDSFANWCSSHDQHQFDQWSSDYQENDMVVFNRFGSSTLFKQVYQEAIWLLDKEGARRELVMKQTGDTPRKYISVGRDDIHRQGGIIPTLFESPLMREFLGRVTGCEVLPVEYTPEQYIINRQAVSGDTHGWHCDDYQWAFIWIMDAPDPKHGGRVEYIPRVNFTPSAPSKSLEEILRCRETRSRWLPAGAAYLMRANRTLHRVTPLTQDASRTVVVMTFASREDINREIDHSTMQALYPRDAMNA